MDLETITLATSLVGFITAVVVGFVVVLKEIRTVHKVINSRMDELLELTRKAARAEGYKAGKGNDRDRNR